VSYRKNGELWLGVIWATDADEVARLLHGARILKITNPTQEQNPFIFRKGQAWSSNDNSQWQKI
jgi:hypothetical protein